MMDKCPSCGAETRPGDNYCLNCGNRLTPSTPSPQQAQPAPGKETWTLWQLQRQLQSKNAETRRQAAEQLGQCKDERAVEALIVALTREEDLLVWYAVAEALMHSGDARAVPALVEVLQHHEDDFVRAAAAEILGKIGGTQTVEVLARALQEDGGMGGVVRAAAAWALGEIGGVQAVEALIAHLEWGDKFEVLCNVVDALGKIGGAQAVEPLARALWQAEDVVRKEAAETLVAIGDPQVVEPLVRVLEEATSAVRQIGTTAFRRIGALRGAGSLLETLHEEATSAVQQRGITALRRVGAFGGASLLPSLQDIEDGPILSLVWALNDKESVMRSAAWALGQLGDARAVEALIAALARHEPWEALRGAVVEAHENIADAGTVELVRALEWNASQEALRRVAVTEALCSIGDPRAVEPLVRGLEEAMSAVQHAAATALRSIGDEEAIGSLLEALHDWDVQWAARLRTPTVPLGGSGGDGEDEGERAASRLPSLQDIEDAQTVLPQVRALNDKEDVVRSAARALGQLGDARAVEALIAALARHEPWEAGRRAVAQALDSIGDAQVGFGPGELSPSARLLGALQGNAALEALRVVTVAQALGSIGDPRAVPALVSLQQDKDGSVRQAAVEALTALGW